MVLASPNARGASFCGCVRTIASWRAHMASKAALIRWSESAEASARTTAEAAPAPSANRRVQSISLLDETLLKEDLKRKP